MYYIPLFSFNTDLTYEISSPFIVTYGSLTYGSIRWTVWSSEVNQFT